MDKEKIFIIGSGGHSKVVIDIIESNEIYKIESIIDFYNKEDKFLGYKIINNLNNLKKILKEISKINIFIAIGENSIREKEYHNILSEIKNVFFPNIIHNSSIISKNVKLGNGIFIGPGVIINSNSIIGSFSLINTKVSIDHDSVIGNFSSIGPGVTMGGGVKIGKFTHIGLGANILEKINIGENSLIGAGSLINKNVNNNILIYGVPGKVIKERNIDDKIYK